MERAIVLANGAAGRGHNQRRMTCVERVCAELGVELVRTGSPEETRQQARRAAEQGYPGFLTSGRARLAEAGKWLSQRPEGLRGGNSENFVRVKHRGAQCDALVRRSDAVSGDTSAVAFFFGRKFVGGGLGASAAQVSPDPTEHLPPRESAGQRNAHPSRRDPNLGADLE